MMQPLALAARTMSRVMHPGGSPTSRVPSMSKLISLVNWFVLSLVAIGLVVGMVIIALRLHPHPNLPPSRGKGHLLPFQTFPTKGILRQAQDERVW